ncbi:GNAT family N-acetyltransferase [Kitasatospora sp. NPDC002551]|uniref:GNAT family N-acetyltransferase n=1 Tax=Kitasatospora sp. NPDC002551 TaxID=3154539 RepID=UPI00332C924D
MTTTQQDHRSPGPIEEGILPSLADVDHAGWDRLAGPDNFYNSSAWAHALELAHGDTALVTAASGGRLLGALPVWPGENDEPGLFHLPTLLPDVTQARSSAYLWLGARRSTYNELVCTRGEARARTLDALFGTALRLARERGLDGVVMPYLAADDARELARRQPRASVLLHDADANLAVAIGGYAEQLARMSQPDRTRRRAERRACERGGTTVLWRPLDRREVVRQTAALVTQTRARHGGTADPAWMLRAFEAQAATGVLDRAVGCFAVREGRPVAVNVCYAHGDRLYARYFGFDYRAAEPHGEYFVLCYQAPVDYAAACGFRRYRLAISAWQIKIRQGAVLSPLAVAVLPLRGRLCDPRTERRHNARTARLWTARCAARPWALDPGWRAWAPEAPARRRPADHDPTAEGAPPCCTWST